MQNLNLTDVGVLYRSLVILPQDLIADTAETETKLAISAEELPILETTHSIEKPQAEEPKTPYGPIHPFVILTAPGLKEAYLAADSPFKKIIAALHIPQTVKYLTTDSTLLQHAENLTCLWCIGLDIATEKIALHSNHPNILLSPDLLQLTTNDEKKAMYIPLKAFITANIATIEQI